MIPAAYITEWGNTVSWPTIDQIEQDLVLSRLIIEIANDAYLGSELMFRGGTCLHKLHLNPAIADRLGMSVTTNIKSFPKIRLRAPFTSGGGMMSVKVEVNTRVRSPAQGLTRIPYTVDSQWYQEYDIDDAAELVIDQLLTRINSPK